MSDTRQRFSAVAGYLLGERMASGGMGTVHLGLKTGALGFQRVVAIKRLHGHLAQDPEFAARFKDEIRLASRLTHTNIVQTLDVVETTGELMLVMECVEGETLSTLLTDTRASGNVLPVEVALGIVIQALHGLHAAHEALDDSGRGLNLVHRDFSPHNIMVNKDGLVKVLDFGIAKAAFESHVTRTGHVCGKFAYISPEQLQGQALDRRADIFSAGVVLWESLTCERLFGSAKIAEMAALRNIMHKRVPPPSTLRPDVDSVVDRIVLRALERDPAKRFETAHDFALALEAACPSASPSTLARALGDFCRTRLTRKASAIADFRKELTNRLSSTQLSVSVPEELADAVSEVHELETRDVQGVVLADGLFRAIPRWNRLWFVAAAVALAALGLVARRALSPNGREKVAHAATTPGYRAIGNKPPLVSVHAAATTSVETTSVETRSVETTSVATTSVETTSGEARSGEVTSGEVTSGEMTPTETTPVEATSEERLITESGASLRRSSRERRKALRAATPVSAAGQCSPPTYTDNEGIRHFKAGCI